VPSHFEDLPDFLYRALQKADFYIGILAGIAFALASYFASFNPGLIATGTILIVATSLFLGAYGVYREERKRRSDLENRIKLTAKIGSMSTNVPEPGPEKVSLRVHVFWEVWVSEDVSTDRLALNLTYLFDRPWWQFWQRNRFPVTGLPPEGKDSTQYRKRLYANEEQPHKDDAVFVYLADRDGGADAHWLLELVLLTGVPIGQFRTPVFVDWEALKSRGTFPPL